MEPCNCRVCTQTAYKLWSYYCRLGQELLWEKIQDLYDTRVRQMAPAERLQLAKLILDDLAPSDKPLDMSDEWSDDDLADLATFSIQQANRPNEGSTGTP